MTALEQKSQKPVNSNLAQSIISITHGPISDNAKSDNVNVKSLLSLSNPQNGTEVITTFAQSCSTEMSQLEDELELQTNSANQLDNASDSHSRVSSFQSQPSTQPDRLNVPLPPLNEGSLNLVERLTSTLPSSPSPDYLKQINNLREEVQEHRKLQGIISN
jgi:hypothetical protein